MDIIHEGAELKARMKKSGISTKDAAARLNMTTQNLCQHFRKEKLGEAFKALFMMTIKIEAQDKIEGISVDSQKYKLSQILISISVDVTSEDRKRAVEDTKLTPGTISQYLLGHGRDNDTAIRLIKVFKKRIADRDKTINELIK